MSWPPGRDTTPAPGCVYSSCRATVAIRCWVKARRTLNSPIVDHEVWPTIRAPGPTSVMEVDEQETWLCLQHNEEIKIAKKRGLVIRRSVEGWLYVDNLDYLRFIA